MRMSVVVSTLVMGLFTLSASPAMADEPSYVEEAVQGLQGDSVIYVATTASSVSESTLESLRSIAEAEDIGIAVLPARAADETGGSVTEFMRQLASQTDHDTVVVVIGSDLEAGSRVLPSGKAAQLANEAERSNSSTSDALTDFVNAVASQEQSTKPDPESGGSDGLPVVGIIGGILLLIAAGAVGVRTIVRNRAATQRTKEEDKQDMPTDLTPVADRIRTLADQIDDGALRSTVLKSLDTTGRLFWRLREKRSNRIHELTSAYEEHLRNVLNVIKFYLDVDRFPEDHSDPKAAIAGTRSSIEGYLTGVQQNIREVTSDAYTEFRVNTRMLESTVRNDTPILKTREEETHDHHDR